MRWCLCLLASAAALASGIRVDLPPTGPAVLRTASAGFQVARDGGISGFLIQGDRWIATGVAAGNRVAGTGTHLDFARARTQDQASATRVEIPWRGSQGLSGTLTLQILEFEPRALTAEWKIQNKGDRPVALGAVSLLGRRMNLSNSRPLWSFIGASFDWGKDEVVALKPGFHRPSQMGTMVKGGFGGGIPVAAFWGPVAGEAVGILESSGCALPVTADDKGRVSAAVTFPERTLPVGASWVTPTLFLAVFKGDFFEPISMWSALKKARGWKIPTPSLEAYQASWCSWGFGSEVDPTRLLGTVPKLKELGISWTTVDFRWFDHFGDWNPRSDTFPGQAMTRLVQDLHRAGEKAQLWWLPLAAEDNLGKGEYYPYSLSRVVREHPEWLVLDSKGQPARMALDLAVLDPSLPAVQAYFRHLAETFIRDWDFDGFKLDNVYAVPPCYNPRHRHASPQESTAAAGEVYRIIFEAAHKLKPAAVIQICPCGTTPSVDWLPWMDQAVTADPVGGVQVRRRIKLYKALLGPSAAVYGDHVELSAMSPSEGGGWLESGQDFASTLAAGGVVGTKFVWPPSCAVPKSGPVDLTPAKDAVWRKWLGIYNDRRLASGTFLNLYTLGFDIPEGYAIAKEGRIHYGFFASGPWKGQVELRGLQPGTYRVKDYGESRDLGLVVAGVGKPPRLEVSFRDHLLLEVAP